MDFEYHLVVDEAEYVEAEGATNCTKSYSIYALYVIHDSRTTNYVVKENTVYSFREIKQRIVID